MCSLCVPYTALLLCSTADNSYSKPFHSSVMLLLRSYSIHVWISLTDLESRVPTFPALPNRLYPNSPQHKYHPVIQYPHRIFRSVPRVIFRPRLNMCKLVSLNFPHFCCCSIQAIDGDRGSDPIRNTVGVRRHLCFLPTPRTLIQNSEGG